MFYAIKSVNEKLMNYVCEDWEECKNIVSGQRSVYKSFATKEECADFLKSAPIKVQNFGKGYISTDVFKKNVLYVKYCFDRCPQKENGYTIKIYETKTGEKIAAKGYYLPNNTRLIYEMRGHFNHNERYGDEFLVESYREHVTDSKSSIVTYLSSGIIKGIGAKKAELIYEKFGSRTMEVLDKEPHELLKVKGISKNGLEKIISSYAENKGAREIISYLLQYGISQKYAMILYNQYQSLAYQKVKENPYILCKLRGLTFKDADNIAEKENLPKDSNERIESAVRSVLKENELSGNTGMEIIDLEKETWSLLNTNKVTPKMLVSKITEYAISRKIRIKKINNIQYAFLPTVFNAEADIAQNIVRIQNCNKGINIMQNDIENMEHFLKINLDDIQKQAVISALNNSLSIITGGPGTGKTTIIKAIDYLYKLKRKQNNRIYLAPTGRASRKIEESTKNTAFTIHSYLHIYGETVEPEEDEVLITDSLVVVDEFSMTDIYIASALFKSIQEGCTVVIVGDDAQLPSVGPGAVLRDMINSKLISLVQLEKVYRQGEDTEIYENAKNIRNGIANIKDGSDFTLIEDNNMENIRNMMAIEYVERIKQFGLGNVMCLCPFKDYTAGVHDMNNILQNMVNPKSSEKMEYKFNKYIFREGDLVMHLKNTAEVSNGDIGIVEKVYDYEKNKELDDKSNPLMFTNSGEPYVLIANINNKKIPYTKDDLKMLQLAYATTVHKSQGSEADAVIMCFTSFHKSMNYRSIPYVGISRGKKHVSIYGEKKYLYEAILNVNKQERITLLGYFLNALNEKFVS